MLSKWTITKVNQLCIQTWPSYLWSKTQLAYLGPCSLHPLSNIMSLKFFIFYVLNHKILPCSLHITFEWLVDFHFQYLKLGCVARGNMIVDLGATRSNGSTHLPTLWTKNSSISRKLALLVAIPESRDSKPAQSNSKRQSGLPKPWLGKIISLKPEIRLVDWSLTACLSVHRWFPWTKWMEASVLYHWRIW